jgi:type II secretion system protein J
MSGYKATALAVLAVAFGLLALARVPPTVARGDAGREAKLREAAKVVERMATELSMAYASAHAPFESPPRMQSGLYARLDGDDSIVDFTSISHARTSDAARESDQNELGYALIDGVLMRRMQTYVDEDFTDGGTASVLLRGVTGFRLRFLDGQSLEWVDTWHARTSDPPSLRLPRQVRITITLPDPEDPSAELMVGTRALLPLHHPLNHAIYR